jgi:uncharacterized membrane protein YfcA
LTTGVILALALAALIGVSLGALGSGGSIVTLPVLVYVAGMSVHAAVEMSLAIVGGTSLVGAFLHYRRRQLHVRATVLFAVAGMVGAYFGSNLTHRVPPHVLMLIFALLMLTVGVPMLRAPREKLPGARCRPVRCLAVGAAVGVLTGFLGVGGGFLIVPALVLLAGLETRQAVGTSLAIIALNSLSGFIGHLGFPALDLKLTLAFLAIALLGLGLGVGLAGRLSERSLRRVFASLVLAMSVVIGLANLRYLIG